MKIKIVRLSIFLIISFFSSAFAQTHQDSDFDYLNPELSIEQRIQDLLSRMTIEEKFWQLFMIPGDLSDGKEKYKNGIFGLQVATKSAGSKDAEQMLQYLRSGTAGETADMINNIQHYFVEETRLGIPIIPFDEALHGLVRDGATAFPQAIGLAATWDVELMSRVATAIAREVKSRGIRQILSPVVNIARDVRWGRVEETYGEDPYLTTQMGVAFVESFEKMGIITTPKHFVANFGDGGRDSYPVHLNERLLREIYFPAFKACIRQAGAQSIMTSYNSLDGVPCSCNYWLLQKNLKHDWDFNGFVISDAGAVGGILDLHHIVYDREESAKVAIEGGLDVIFQTAYDHHIPLLKAFKDGMIAQEAIDAAVSRVLRAKIKLGLFEDPYVDPNEAVLWNGHPDHRKLALQASRKAIVLLKNDFYTLPLNKKIPRLLILGPDAVEARLGGYSGPGINKVSILNGIKNKVSGKTKLIYIEGPSRRDVKMIPITNKFLETDQGMSGLRGEYFNNIDFSGKAALIRNDQRINFNWTLFGPHPTINQDWFSVKWTGHLKAPKSGPITIGVEGDDGYRLYLDGKLVIGNWKKQSYGIRTFTIDFKNKKSYSIKLEFFESLGNSRLRLLWDADVGNIDNVIGEATNIARECDAIIIVAGIEEGEFRDRADLNLSSNQEMLIQKMVATGKPVIVLLVGGSAVTMLKWIDHVPAVLCLWYPGEAGGDAVADVLFGDYNPGGKLPISFPQSAAQLPLYYNHKPTGRGDDYSDMSGEPLFPFGYGLSYTTFEYSDLQIIPETFKLNQKSTVKFKITNSGKVAGDEVAQLYIRDLVASVTRPVMELKGFQRVILAPGESKEVEFELNSDNLSMLNQNLESIVEPGEFKIMIGSSSRDIRLRGFVQVIQ